MKDDVFGVWRSCQHYAARGSLPDATSRALEKVLDPTVAGSSGRKKRFVAKKTGTEWRAQGFAREGTLEQTTTAQLRKYDRVRKGEITWSNDAYTELTRRDHPQRTTDLDANP